MPNRNDEMKRIESLVLGAARQAGAPIPVGERRGTEPAPDFWIETDDGGLGVELTEFLGADPMIHPNREHAAAGCWRARGVRLPPFARRKRRMGYPDLGHPDCR
jgi:hypothetical protein